MEASILILIEYVYKSFAKFELRRDSSLLFDRANGVTLHASPVPESLKGQPD
jgi:hypothetical protein